MLQRRIFQRREYYIQGVAYSGLWYTKIYNDHRVAWIDQYYYFICFTKFSFSVSMALNLWKVEMVSDPYKYLLLIVGFYKRSVPFFFYVIQCWFYLKDLPIGNMVSCWSCVVGTRYMDYKHYSFKKIFIAHGWYKTEVELVSLFETGVEGLQWW